MNDPRTSSEIAIELVERKIIAAKREADHYEAKGLPIPDHVTRKIMNLKGAAVALRGPKNGENR